MFGMAAVFIVGLSVAGARQHDEDQREHGLPAEGYAAYVTSGDFVEAVFENWESEFLQMGAYVLLTAFLVQKGSAESKSLEGDDPQDEDPRRATIKAGTPWPVRAGGAVLRVYEHSLTIALFAMFAASMWLHAVTGAKEYSADQVVHGGAPVGTWAYLHTSRFWFESLQNWQSEFLAVFAIVVLSIWLREKGSPESKPVAAPHAMTGSG
jgi:hypothetical protein